MTTSRSDHALPPDVLPANFTISEKAKIVIEDVRREWNERFGDPAVAVWISWGIFRPHSGPSFENVVVSFYGQSQLSNIADAIQNVSGLDVVLFTIPAYLHHFDGKVLDHDPKRGFFLRDP